MVDGDGIIRELWSSLFEKSVCCKVSREVPEIRGILLLLETVIHNVKNLGLKHVEVTEKLNLKTKECLELKSKKSECEKCPQLEEELLDAKKQAKEARNRIESIAKILKIGDELQSSQTSRQSCAFTLVSQLLVGESPKRKKRRISKEATPVKTPSKAEDPLEIIMDTVQPSPLKDVNQSPLNADKHYVNIGDEIISSDSSKQAKKRLINLPTSNICGKPSVSARKNLSAEFVQEDSPEKAESEPVGESPRKELNLKPIGTEAGLDESLLEYVKEGQSELDRIFGGGSGSPKIKIPNKVNKSPKTLAKPSLKPENPVKDLNSSWQFKESREVVSVTGGKRMRQMKLNLSIKGKSPPDPEDTWASEIPSTSRNKPPKVSDPSPDLTIFAPTATSTQNILEQTDKNNDFKQPKRDNAKKKNQPVFGSIRTKAAKAALDGIQCKDCAQYYELVGKDMSPGELQTRLNKCSKHRNKHRYRNETPPGLHNPLMPDTLELTNMGLYNASDDE